MRLPWPLDLPVGGISCRDTLLSCCDSVPGQGHATNRTVTHSGAHERAAARKYGQLQVEDEEMVPDRRADDAVVAIIPVPATVAVVPDAVAERAKLADPAPPLIRSSSVSLSSMMISMRMLHYHSIAHTRLMHQPRNHSFGPFCPCVKFIQGKSS
jgi:hypothetical protein